MLTHRLAAAALLACLSALASAQAPAPAPAQPAPPAAAQPKTPAQPEMTPDGRRVFPGPKGKKVAFPLKLYDESADGAALIREALTRARADNRRVLVMWGENYCGFCSELHDLLTWEDPRLRTLVATEYELVKVDLGKQFSNIKHIDLARTYGVDIHTSGAPALTIIDPANSKAVASVDGKVVLAKPMTMQRVYDDQKLFEFLFENRPVPKIAMTVFSEQLVFASRAGKKLLVWFGEPESDASAELHRWFNDPSVAATLDAGYLVLKIDPQRMTTGRMVMDRVTGKPGAPCPFIAIVNSQGQPIDESALLTGYPSTTEQRAALRAAIVAHGGAIDAAKLDAAMAKLPEKPTPPAPRGPDAP